MKLLVDMNLSPSWVGRLAQHGFEAVHWSTIGAANAPDVEILAWANEHQFVVITNDLDFSAILAATRLRSPRSILVADCWTSIDEKQWGNTDSGAVFPHLGARFCAKRAAA